MSNPSIDPNATNSSVPLSTENDLPPPSPSTEEPEGTGGPEDTLEQSTASATTAQFVMDQPTLDFNYLTYLRDLGTARLLFNKENSQNEAANLRLTKEYWREIAERCKLTREQRDRLENHYHKWVDLVNKINLEVADMNTYVQAYNGTQLPADNDAITQFNAAINQYNFDGDLVAFQIAVNNYNNYFIGSNSGGILIYDNQATAFNAEVDANNEEIEKLNEFAANFTPPLPLIPLQGYAQLAGQVSLYPAPPYVTPLPFIQNRLSVLLQISYSDPPPLNSFTDPTLAGDQQDSLKSLLFSRQLLDSKDTYVRFIHFVQRGTIPNVVDTYIHTAPKPRTGGAASSMTGASATLFQDNSIQMEGQLSLATMLAVLSEYDKIPEQFDPGLYLYQKEIVKEDFIKIAVEILSQTSILAAISAGKKFEGILKGNVDDNVNSLLISLELSNIITDLKGLEGSELLKAIAAELIKGIPSLQGASAEEILAATNDIQLLLLNLLALFTLQSVSFALNAPGLTAQVLANAAPQYADEFTPPSEADLLNSYLLGSTAQLEQFKSVFIEQLSHASQVPKRVVAPTVEESTEVAVSQGPYESVGEFMSVLESLITQGKLPDDFKPRVKVSAEPEVTPSKPRVAPQPIEVTPVPENVLSVPQYREAVSKVVEYLVNELPLPFATGKDLGRPLIRGEINPNTFANSAASRRILEGTRLDRPTFERVIDRVVSRQPTTVRDLRNDIVRDSLESFQEHRDFNYYDSLNDSIVIGNRTAQEIVDGRISQENFNVNRLDNVVVRESLKRSILQTNERTEDLAATDVVRQQIQDSEADAIATRVVERLFTRQNTERLMNENEVRLSIQRQLMTEFNIYADRAAEIAMVADFRVERPPSQALLSLGVEKVLPLPVLAEELNKLIMKQLAHVLPPDRLSPFANDMTLKILGAHNIINDIEIAQLENPASMLRIIKDTVFYYHELENQNVSRALASDFRERMAPQIDAYVFSVEMMDPGKLYLRSKFEGISYTRNEPSFRSSIDIII